jgi:hypothetical protein
MADIKNRIEELQKRVAEAKEGVRATMTIHELGKESIREIISEVAETQAVITAMFDKEDGKLSASSKVLKEELDNLVKEGTDADSARLRQIQSRAKDIAAVASDQGGIAGDYITELADSLATGSTRAAKVKMGSVMPQSDMFGAGIFKTIFGANFTDWALGGEAYDPKAEPSSKRNRANLKLKQAQAELDSIDGSGGTSTSASESAEIRREGEQRQGEIKHKENQVITLLEKILSAVTGKSFSGGGGGAGGAGGGGPDGEMSGGDLTAFQELGAIVGSQLLFTKGGKMGSWIWRALGGGAGAGASLAGSSRFTALTVGGKSIQGMGALGSMGAWTAKALGIVAGSAAVWTTAGIGAAIWGIGTMMIKKYEGEAKAMEAAHGFFMGHDYGPSGVVVDKATGVFLKGPHLNEPLYEGQQASDRYSRRLLIANAELINLYIQNARQLSDQGASDSEVMKWLNNAQAAANLRPSMVRKVKGPGGKALSQIESEQLLKFGNNETDQFKHNHGTSSRYMVMSKNLNAIYERFSQGWGDGADRNTISATMDKVDAIQGVSATRQFGQQRDSKKLGGDVEGAIRYARQREGMVRESMLTGQEQINNNRARYRGENVPLIIPTDMTGDKWQLLNDWRNFLMRRENLEDFGYDNIPNVSTNYLSPEQQERMLLLEQGPPRVDNNAVAGAIVEELKRSYEENRQINALAITNNSQSTVVAGDIADQNSIYDKSRKNNFSNANHGGGNIHQFHP